MEFCLKGSKKHLSSEWTMTLIRFLYQKYLFRWCVGKGLGMGTQVSGPCLQFHIGGGSGRVVSG